jgi:hypothetical protein
MKKKYRDIVIDGENWAWRFKKRDDCYGTQFITIWRDKKIVYEKSYMYNRNKKSYSVTPGLVGRFIKTYLKK